MVGQRSPTEEYTGISIEEAIKRLSTDSKTGLSTKSVKERIHRQAITRYLRKNKVHYLIF